MNSYEITDKLSVYIHNLVSVGMEHTTVMDLALKIAEDMIMENRPHYLGLSSEVAIQASKLLKIAQEKAIEQNE